MSWSYQKITDKDKYNEWSRSIFIVLILDNGLIRLVFKIDVIKSKIL